MNISDPFTPAPAPSWRRRLVGTGTLEPTDSTVRLVTTDATRHLYSDAQLDDFHGPPRPWLPWNPPLRMTIRARFSHPQGVLRGTAGFGFWNYPWLRLHAPRTILPCAIWFFYGSQPCDMKLDRDAPGYGWKAATVDTRRWSALRLLPFAPLAVPLMNIPALYRVLWPPIQRAVRVQEQPLQSDMTCWHIYTIDWGTQHAHFSIDGQTVLEYAPAPAGPLCFVLWIDNQYAIVKPWGKFGWGLLDIPGRQWLEVDWLAIEKQG
jgi:hypothetical protein